MKMFSNVQETVNTEAKMFILYFTHFQNKIQMSVWHFKFNMIYIKLVKEKVGEDLY